VLLLLEGPQHLLLRVHDLARLDGGHHSMDWKLGDPSVLRVELVILALELYCLRILTHLILLLSKHIRWQ
jgi:hypothetical protein